VRDHLRAGPPLDARLPLTDDRLWRWVFKTAFNLHRCGNHPVDWALPLRAYLTGTAPRPANLDLLFAAWDDLSPGRVALGLNIVHYLDARPPHFDMLDTVSQAAVDAEALMTTAIKPGYGVFLAAVWKRPASPVAAIVHGELLAHGWLDCTADATPTAVPFDTFTSGQFQSLVPSGRHRAFIVSRGAALADELAAFQRNRTGSAADDDLA
jgi:hypothetical protein